MQGGCWMSLGLRGLSLSLIVSLIGCPEPASGKSLLPRWLYFMKKCLLMSLWWITSIGHVVSFTQGVNSLMLVLMSENSRVNSTWKHGNTGFEKAILGWCLFMDSFGWTWFRWTWLKYTYGPDQTGGRRSELQKTWDTRYLSTRMSTHAMPGGFPPFPPVASCDIAICNKKYIFGSSCRISGTWLLTPLGFLRDKSHAGILVITSLFQPHRV